MTEVPLTEEQWVSLCFFRNDELVEWFQTEGIEVPSTEVAGDTKTHYAQRKLLFKDPTAAITFKLRWL